MGSAGATSYSWDSGSVSPQIVVTPVVTTTYVVTGTNASNCSSQESIVLNVDACTGVAKLNNNLNAALYPNPSTGDFVIGLTQTCDVTIFNGLGEIVFTKRSVNGNQQVTLAGQPNGVYFVQLNNGSQTKTMKMIKN